MTTLTHDLRGPLSVILTGGVLLQGKIDDAEALKLLATRIVRNAQRADDMLCDLLDANRLKAGERMPLSVQECRLDHLLETISGGLTELHGARFRMRNEAGAVPGLWDGKAIRRVVENLAGNAVKYGQRDAPISLSLTRSEDWAELAVHNEGNAISLKEQDAIFLPFYRTPSATSGRQPGWGVGLTLVKAIAEAHGGSARVQSDPVGGTTFSFAFRSKEALRLERQACRANLLGVRGLVGLARRAGALLHGRSFSRAPLDCGPPGKRPQSAPCGSRGRLV